MQNFVFEIGQKNFETVNIGFMEQPSPSSRKKIKLVKKILEQ